MNLPQCLQSILYACPKLSQSEQKSRRENKFWLSLQTEGFQILHPNCLPAGKLNLSLAYRKRRAGVGSLCLVLEKGWELPEAGALVPCTEIAKYITARSVQPYLGRTGASPWAGAGAGCCHVLLGAWR